MHKFVEVVSYETGEVINRVDVSEKTDRMIGKVMDGMAINMSEDFYTRLATDAAAIPASNKEQA